MRRQQRHSNTPHLCLLAPTTKTTNPTVTVQTLKVCCTGSSESMDVAYLPGIVRAGELAAVRTPEGLRFRRPHYYRDAGREMVCLELGGLAPLCYPLAEVEILGTLLCGCDERGCA